MPDPDDAPTRDISGVEPDPVALEHAAVRLDNATPEEGDDDQ